MFEDEGKIVTIQQTGKRWKGIWAISRIGMAIGFFMLFSGHDNISTGLWLMFGSFVLGLYARAGGWWHHG